MQAVIIERNGEVGVLNYTDIPTPIPGSGQVLVHMKAAALNHLDIWVRRGFPGVPLPIIPGSDGAGVVVDIGLDVRKFKPGDAVILQPVTYCGNCRFCKRKRENFCERFGIFGETRDGTNCEFMAVAEKYLRPKPNWMDFTEAAAFPLVAMTAYTMLIKRAELRSDETVLVWGAGSGIGHMAIQIAKWKGCFVIATAGNDSKLEQARALGADLVINHYRENVAEIVKPVVGKQGVDVVFEHVGKATWDISTKLLAKGGRIVTCGATTGAKVNLDLRHIFYKQQSIIGSTMGDVAGFEQILKLIDSKQLKVIIDRTFLLSEIAAAHSFLEQGEQFGKIVLSI